MSENNDEYNDEYNGEYNDENNDQNDLGEEGYLENGERDGLPVPDHGDWDPERFGETPAEGFGPDDKETSSKGDERWTKESAEWKGFNDKEEEIQEEVDAHEQPEDQPEGEWTEEFDDEGMARKYTKKTGWN